jgi:hypothetical protein
MKLGIISGVIGSFIMVFIPFNLFSGSSQSDDGDYWSMNGVLIEHEFNDSLDLLSDQVIFELQDKNGLPVWFGRYIFKDVCILGQCRMVSIWLFWDGAGNYLGIQLLDDEPLTKSDHTEFELEDYAKLESILKNPNSILKDKNSEDLTLKPESDNPFEVDGYSGATQPALAEVVVEDAVYTCHTLWHTVYGPTRDKIKEILEERVDEDYLSLMLESGNPDFVIWGIRSIKQFPRYHDSFYHFIVEEIKSDYDRLYEEAIGYFGPDKMEDHIIIDNDYTYYLHDSSGTGLFFYSRYIEKVFGADVQSPTPATTMTDGVDYLPLPWWRVFLIQFLNIAGLGPIFGAVAGAMWGPVAYIWIVLGAVFAGGCMIIFRGCCLSSIMG